MAWQGWHSRRYGASSRPVSCADISPFTIGFVAMSRISAATTSRASRTGIPAAFSGREASKIRFAASASLHGAVAAATAAISARR